MQLLSLSWSFKGIKKHRKYENPIWGREGCRVALWITHTSDSYHARGTYPMRSRGINWLTVAYSRTSTKSGAWGRLSVICFKDGQLLWRLVCLQYIKRALKRGLLLENESRSFPEYTLIDKGDKLFLIQLPPLQVNRFHCVCRKRWKILTKTLQIRF